MQTFLPFPSFSQSAAALDRLRLGKQRVECKQILEALLGNTSAWSRHPITLAWQGYEDYLAAFGRACCTEWRRRGYRDSLLEYFERAQYYLAYDFADLDREVKEPFWFELPITSQFYRALLFAKAPELYQNFTSYSFPPFCSNTTSMLIHVGALEANYKEKKNAKRRKKSAPAGLSSTCPSLRGI